MFKRTASDLGLDQVLENVASYALSLQGKSAVKRAIPVFEEKQYSFRQENVTSVINAQIKAQTQELSAEIFSDISPVFDFILQNPTGALEGPLIYDVGQYIKSAVILRKIFCLNSEGADISQIISEPDEELCYLSQEIFRILDSDGTVKESYPSVRALIEKAEAKRIERTRTASELLRENNELMNGDNAVLRNGRLVLPVRNDMHSKMSGYVQGCSQSGATVFMEPFRLVDMNNAVNIAVQEIEIEIARLLNYLTVMIRKTEQKLRILVSQITEADFLYAFATWARKNNCCKVSYNEKYTCNLLNARHPLLKENCVPIDLIIDNCFKAVVLTGPNAGGKTVTMKTVGLFSLINQICGYIPASDGSSLALFDRVFTDIGDDQSIENRLSTFSGHMKSISFVLRSVTADSLVILDELGSGTDPQEGAALARSILEYCTNRAKLTLTTSHHGVLKQYAYSSENVLNASMEFDEKTLEPTFKVISGLPGESHAIDTAIRMHLPKSVTTNAQKYMGKEAVKISSIIRGLEQKRKETDEMNSEITIRLNEVKKQQKELAEKERKVAAFENNFKKEQLRDFDVFVKGIRKELEGLVRELREGEITKEKTKKVKEEILKLEKIKNDREEKIKERESELEYQDYEELLQSAENVHLKAGMDVLCGQFKREGTIIKEAGHGKWIVAIGTMKFTFKETELAVPRRTVERKNYIFEKGSQAPMPKLNLDLRGMRLVEALEAIDDEIEACYVHGITSFSVIHGYGDGILSSGIQKHLKMNEIVAEYHFAHPDDGGQGKTYVTLK